MAVIFDVPASRFLEDPEVLPGQAGAGSPTKESNP
jgi:hypothetical protein